MSLQSYNRYYGANELVQIYVGNNNVSASQGTGYSIWNKPKGIKYVTIYAVGGGGGGGGGGSQTVTAGGGGAGAGAAMAIGLFLAHAIPDTLYVRPGKGGSGGTGQINGGAAATAGIQGGYSHVALSPATTSETSFVDLILGFPGSGGNAGGATAGTAGAVFPTLTVSHVQYISMSTFVTLPGTLGSNGTTASNANTVSAIISTNPATCAGAGGGGVDNSVPPATPYNGGNIIIPKFILGETDYIISGGLGGSLGGSGLDGYGFNEILLNNMDVIGNIKPFFTTGGSGGGGSSGTGNPGGKGGNGGLGSGGGGGGGTVGGSGSAGGRGGDGGPGYVIISCS